MNKAKYQILNNFAIKIIAIITMTLDHIGVLLMDKYGKIALDDPKFWTNPMSASGYVLRVIGRLSLPLIALSLVEGIRHTKNKENYLIRLFAMAGIILIGEVIAKYALNMSFDGNIFLLLGCSYLFIYLIEKNNKYSYLAIIPLFFIIMGSVLGFYTASTGGEILWWPIFLKPQYDLYGFLIIVGFYYSYKLADKHLQKIKEDNNLTKDINELKKYAYYRTLVNWFMIAVILIVNIFYWLLARGDTRRDIYYMSIQSWAILSIIAIFLYNGEKGYKSKITQYAFYVYYPLHLVIIFVIFRIIFGY